MRRRWKAIGVLAAALAVAWIIGVATFAAWDAMGMPIDPILGGIYAIGFGTVAVAVFALYMRKRSKRGHKSDQRAIRP